MTNKVVTRTFTREFMEEHDYPWELVSQEFVESHRWYDVYTGVFEYEGKNWQVSYLVPSTEMQEEDPWNEDDEIEATEVVWLPVVVNKWVPKSV